MTINIYDGMAVLRRRFDTDLMGSGPRGVFNDMLALPSTDVAIWCFEGKGSKAERQKIYPGYKDRPSTMTSGIFALIDLVRKAMAHTRAMQIAVPGREADDVIAHLCQTYGAGGHSVVVHTVDRDLKALETRNVRVECNDVMLKPVAADRAFDRKVKAPYVRLFKTLTGDSSDCIPGMKGFGQKTYSECNEQSLLEAMLYLVAGQPDAQRFVAAGVKPAMAGRIVAPENVALLHAFWTIIGFMPLPDDWMSNLTIGVPDRAAGNLVLKEFMH